MEGVIDRTDSRRFVLVTGASTGIGRKTAEMLCGLGFGVFGSLRQAGDAEALQAALGEHFIPLIFDVTDGDAVARAAETVQAHLAGRGLYGLVNNAGISIDGPLTAISPARLRHQLEVNVVGVLQVVQAFLPLLRINRDAGRPGRIVNISSVSGRLAYPFMGPYAASKHALEALSDSLRRELMIYGVDVVVIQPGVIDTPIWDKAAHVRDSFQGTDYGRVLGGVDLTWVGRRGLPPEAVAKRIHVALTHPRPRARYVISEAPFRRWLIPRGLPDRWLDRAIDRALKLSHIRDALR